MLELFLGLMMWTVPQWTGKAFVFLVSFGQARCEEGLAEVVGFAVWLTLALGIAVVLVRG